MHTQAGTCLCLRPWLPFWVICSNSLCMWDLYMCGCSYLCRQVLMRCTETSSESYTLHSYFQPSPRKQSMCSFWDRQSLNSCKQGGKNPPFFFLWLNPLPPLPNAMHQEQEKRVSSDFTPSHLAANMKLISPKSNLQVAVLSQCKQELGTKVLNAEVC